MTSILTLIILQWQIWIYAPFLCRMDGRAIKRGYFWNFYPKHIYSTVNQKKKKKKKKFKKVLKIC